MRRLSGILLLLLGISFVPVNTQFSANAGRAGMGDAASAECSCEDQGPPDCYYDHDPYQLCNGVGDRHATEQTSKQVPDSSQDTTVSAGLLLLVAYLLFKRIL